MSKQKRDIENSEDRQTGTGRGCDVTTNPGGTRKLDNPLKGIRYPITHNPDNPLKGIRDLVQNGNWSQWQRGSTIPT